MRAHRVATFLFGVFFLAATIILISVGTSLLWPGLPFDAIWLLRPDRQAPLTPYRQYLGPAFLLLAIPAALASIAFFLRKRWGLWLAVTIFAANGLGDVGQIVMGRLLEGAFGVVVAGALIFYLTRPSTRAAFGASSGPIGRAAPRLYGPPGHG